VGSTLTYAVDDCRTTFQTYKKSSLAERITRSGKQDIAMGGVVYGGLALGGIIESTGALGTAATLGSAVSIGAAFVPLTVYLGIEGGIALVNSPHSKAIKLIDQSYTYRDSKHYKKTKLLKRMAKRLNTTTEDLAETIIRSNEDGTLCSQNKTKKDIIESIRLGEIHVIDVEESTYSGDTLRWTCGAQTKYYQGEIYSASANKKSVAKKKAKAMCAAETGAKCKWILYCENTESDTVSQRF
jgi:hypothetical protein